jgi:hypothetical protein
MHILLLVWELFRYSVLSLLLSLLWIAKVFCTFAWALNLLVLVINVAAYLFVEQFVYGADHYSTIEYFVGYYAVAYLCRSLIADIRKYRDSKCYIGFSREKALD